MMGGGGGFGNHLGQSLKQGISFPFSLKILNEVWLQITRLFLRKTSFNFEI